MKMTGEDLPETVEDLRNDEEQYQARIDAWEEANPESTMGSVLFPREGASKMAVRAYHEVMMNEGVLGVEYVQEALHGNGDYFDDFFDSVEEVKEDVERFREMV